MVQERTMLRSHYMLRFSEKYLSKGYFKISKFHYQHLHNYITIHLLRSAKKIVETSSKFLKILKLEGRTTF